MPTSLFCSPRHSASHSAAKILRLSLASPPSANSPPGFAATSPESPKQCLCSHSMSLSLLSPGLLSLFQHPPRPPSSLLRRSSTPYLPLSFRSRSRASDDSKLAQWEWPDSQPLHPCHGGLLLILFRSLFSFCLKQSLAGAVPPLSAPPIHKLFARRTPHLLVLFLTTNNLPSAWNLPILSRACLRISLFAAPSN